MPKIFIIRSRLEEQQSVLEAEDLISVKSEAQLDIDGRSSANRLQQVVKSTEWKIPEAHSVNSQEPPLQATKISPIGSQSVLPIDLSVPRKQPAIGDLEGCEETEDKKLKEIDRFEEHESIIRAAQRKVSQIALLNHIHRFPTKCFINGYLRGIQAAAAGKADGSTNSKNQPDISEGSSTESVSSSSYGSPSYGHSSSVGGSSGDGGDGEEPPDPFKHWNDLNLIQFVNEYEELPVNSELLELGNSQSVLSFSNDPLQVSTIFTEAIDWSTLGLELSAAAPVCESALQALPLKSIQQSKALQELSDKGTKPSAASTELLCSECSKKFATKRSLNRHMKRHVDNKKHVCTICKKGFSDSFDLKRHTRTHTKVHPFKCNLCEKSFAQRCSLENHCLKSHGMSHQFAFNERRTKVNR